MKTLPIPLLISLFTLLSSCDINETPDPPISYKELSSCYRDSVWDENKIKNSLTGTWQLEFLSCACCPNEAQYVLDQSVIITFKSDSTLVVMQNDSTIQTSSWIVVDGDADLFALDTEPPVNTVYGRILICGDYASFDQSYIDICTNYLKKMQ